MITKTGFSFAAPAVKSFGKGLGGVMKHPLTLGITGMDLASGNQSLTGSVVGTAGGAAGSLLGEGLASKLFRGNKYMKMLGMIAGGAAGFGQSMKLNSKLPQIYQRADKVLPPSLT
jgi:hypothetical protein